MLCEGVGIWGWRPLALAKWLQKHTAVIITFKWHVFCQWMTSVALSAYRSSFGGASPLVTTPYIHLFSLCLFCDLLLPLPIPSHHMPLLSFHCSPSVSLSLFLFFSGCVFSYFSWQVNRWFWSQWRCTFSPLSPSESLFLAQQFIGVALLRRCVKCYSISPTLHHTIWMWD